MLKRRMCRSVLTAALVASALGTASIVEAHHGWSSYDSTRLLTLTGTAREVVIENPHGMLRLETPDKTWTIVLSPPSRMERRGLPRESIEVGEEVTVEGYPHQSVVDELRAERITIDGQTVELR